MEPSGDALLFLHRSHRQAFYAQAFYAQMPAKYAEEIKYNAGCRALLIGGQADGQGGRATPGNSLFSITLHFVHKKLSDTWLLAKWKRSKIVTAVFVAALRSSRCEYHDDGVYYNRSVFQVDRTIQIPPDDVLAST